MSFCLKKLTPKGLSLVSRFFTISECRAEFIRAMPSVVKNTPEGSNCAAKQDHYVKEKSSYVFLSKNPTSEASPTVDCRLLSVDDIVIDLHFNAHTNPNARGTEAIVADDATTLELRFASRLAHTTSDALDIPLRCIKSESETPHHRLAMLHLTPQSIILEVCFCTSPEDVEAYRNNREKLAADLAWAIYELL